jgi:hypothetical protein
LTKNVHPLAAVLGASFFGNSVDNFAFVGNFAGHLCRGLCRSPNSPATLP